MKVTVQTDKEDKKTIDISSKGVRILVVSEKEKEKTK